MAHRKAQNPNTKVTSCPKDRKRIIFWCTKHLKMLAFIGELKYGVCWGNFENWGLKLGKLGFWPTLKAKS